MCVVYIYIEYIYTPTLIAVEMSSFRSGEAGINASGVRHVSQRAHALANTDDVCLYSTRGKCGISDRH